MGSTQNLAHNELGIFIWFNQLKVKMMVCSMFVLISKRAPERFPEEKFAYLV